MLKVIVLALAMGLLFLYLLQDTLLFFPQPVADEYRRQFASHEVTMEHQGVRLQGWFVDGEVSALRPLLVYYGGNAEEVSGNLGAMDRFSNRIGAFLYMNYRGYGDSEGKPSQQSLFQDAAFVLEQLMLREGIEPAQVVLMGRSLGTAVAVYVASRYAVQRVILVSPFDTLLHVAQHHYPYLPVRLLLKYQFDSSALAPTIAAPALILIAAQDRIIPEKFSLNLSRQWGGPVDVVTIEGAGHNDISTYASYWQAITAFLALQGKE